MDLAERAERNGKQPIDEKFATLPVQYSNTGGFVHERSSYLGKDKSDLG